MSERILFRSGMISFAIHVFLLSAVVLTFPKVEFLQRTSFSFWGRVLQLNDLDRKRAQESSLAESGLIVLSRPREDQERARLIGVAMDKPLLSLGGAGPVLPKKFVGKRVVIEENLSSSSQADAGFSNRPVLKFPEH